MIPTSYSCVEMEDENAPPLGGHEEEEESFEERSGPELGEERGEERGRDETEREGGEANEVGGGGEPDGENERGSEAKAPLLRLPKEVIREILTYLEGPDLISACQVCSTIHYVAGRFLFRKLFIQPDDLQTKTVHQFLYGYLNVRELVMLRGMRVTKSFCQRVAKDLPKLKSLCLHLQPSTTHNVYQELSNITTILPHLTSLEIHFAELNFTIDGLIDEIKKLTSLEKLHLILSGNRSPEDDSNSLRRMDNNLFVTHLSTLPNATLKDLKINFDSYRDVRRFTMEGVKPLILRYWRTLTSLHLRHIDLGHSTRAPCSEVYTCFSFLKNLKHLGLTGVEGFNVLNWTELFVFKPDLSLMRNVSLSGLYYNHTSALLPSRHYVAQQLPTFPALESAELDFLPDAFLFQLGKIYGSQLKKLTLLEYSKIFVRKDDHMGNVTSPEELTEILQNFHTLTKLTLGIKSNSFDERARKVVKWFASGHFDCINYPIEIVKL